MKTAIGSVAEYSVRPLTDSPGSVTIDGRVANGRRGRAGGPAEVQLLVTEPAERSERRQNQDDLQHGNDRTSFSAARLTRARHPGSDFHLHRPTMTSNLMWRRRAAAISTTRVGSASPIMSSDAPATSRARSAQRTSTESETRAPRRTPSPGWHSANGPGESWRGVSSEPEVTVQRIPGRRRGRRRPHPVVSGTFA